MNRQTVVLACLIVFSGLFSSLVSAAGVLRNDKSASDWEILLSPYLWATSLEGETNGVPVDASFGDVVDNLNMALSLHTEFHKGKWAFVVDPTYLSLEMDIELPAPLTPKANIDIWIVELWGAYKFVDHWEVLGGARYQDQDIALTGLGAVPAPPAPAGGFPDPVNIKDDWLDWFAGVRFNYPLGEKWFVVGRGDVVFAGDSDSSQNLELFFNRRFGKNMALNLGYRYFKDDYNNAPKYTWDVKQHGPAIGYTWAF